MKNIFRNLAEKFSMTETELTLLLLILLVGAVARLWRFGVMPPGINVDEASIGIEAYDLYKFGVDRNGFSYPIHLASWGSGQNALYAYALLPLIPLLGLNAVSIRLPMVLAGILSLPLAYLAGRKIINRKYGLAAAFFMAISPWHVVNSRWAVESNIMPFLFLAGFVALLYASPKNGWFAASVFFFALCLYAYGTTYVGVPVFLLIAVPLLLSAGRVTFKQAVFGLSLFALLALPIFLFILVNTFQWESIQLGTVTIPRLPAKARYEAMAAVFGNQPLVAFAENLRVMLRLLWSQEDAYAWNFVAPFGYFYKVTSLFILIGFFLVFSARRTPETQTERGLLLAWIFASLAVGIAHPTNLTRLNLIFTPLLLCFAFFVFELEKRLPAALPLSAAALSIGFVLFMSAYHGEEYQKRAGGVFNAGILPAVEYVRERSASKICFTEGSYSLYIYALFAEKPNPAEYLGGLEWISPADPADPARTPRQIGRYYFRLADCADDPQAAYILLLKETPPNSSVEYKSRKFEKFEAFLPK